MGRDVALEVPGGWIKVSAVELAAIAKRARKREKREEDARRTEEGRTSAAWGAGALGLPWRAGFWDYYEGVWSGHYSGRLRGPLNLWLSSREPRWRLRLEHRRALPMASTWLDSEAQFLRLRRPRSFMTRAWRCWRRGIAAASWRLAQRGGE